MDNKERMDRLKTALKCVTNAELARKINEEAGQMIVYSSTIPQWKKRGMNRPMASIIDLLLKEIDMLKENYES